MAPIRNNTIHGDNSRMRHTIPTQSVFIWFSFILFIIISSCSVFIFKCPSSLICLLNYVFCPADILHILCALYCTESISVAAMLLMHLWLMWTYSLFFMLVYSIFLLRNLHTLLAFASNNFLCRIV